MTGRSITAAALAGAVLAACSGPAPGRVTDRRYTPAKNEVVVERCRDSGCAVRPVPVARAERWTLTVADVVDVRTVEVTRGEWAACPAGAVYPECAGGER